jgi:hypothetical protein
MRAENEARCIQGPADSAIIFRTHRRLKVDVGSNKQAGLEG